MCFASMHTGCTPSFLVTSVVNTLNKVDGVCATKVCKNIGCSTPRKRSNGWERYVVSPYTVQTQHIIMCLLCDKTYKLQVRKRHTVPNKGAKKWYGFSFLWLFGKRNGVYFSWFVQSLGCKGLASFKICPKDNLSPIFFRNFDICNEKTLSLVLWVTIFLSGAEWVEWLEQR